MRLAPNPPYELPPMKRQSGAAVWAIPNGFRFGEAAYTWPKQNPGTDLAEETFFGEDPEAHAFVEIWRDHELSDDFAELEPAEEATSDEENAAVPRAPAAAKSREPPRMWTAPKGVYTRISAPCRPLAPRS